MSETLMMEKDELVRRAKRYVISKLNLEAAREELKKAQARVDVLFQDNKKAWGHLCCSPLQFRTTVVLLEHPNDEEEEQMVVVVRHEKHERDGDLWDVQMVEVTAR